MHWQLAHYFKAILLFAVPSKEIVVGYDCQILKIKLKLYNAL